MGNETLSRPGVLRIPPEQRVDQNLAHNPKIGQANARPATTGNPEAPPRGNRTWKLARDAEGF